MPQFTREQLLAEKQRRAALRQQQSIAPSASSSFARGLEEGITAGFSGELQGIGGAIEGVIDPNKTAVEGYRMARNRGERKIEAAREAHPVLSTLGNVAGGLVTAPIAGGATNVGRAAIGAGIGAASALGASEADLTKGEVGKAAADTATGAAIGGVIGSVAKPVANTIGDAVGSVAKKLEELGNARLFKAAVGQTKRAYTQLDGKGLLEKAGEYLNKIGIGIGDSTESIGKKLAERQVDIGDKLGQTVEMLDKEAGKRISISPISVSNRIAKEVAEPLKNIVAARKEYAEILDEIRAIRTDQAGKIRKNISFSEAVQQRSAAQKQVNYDSQNGRDIAAQAKREIASIWNDEIDKKAESILEKAGMKSDAYKELRHEYGLVTELLKHVENRIQGNAANRVLSPSDYGAGGIAGIMTGNPILGIAAAAANHIGRVYGNAAAGRTAINMSRAVAAGRVASDRVLPPALVSLSVPASLRKEDNEK